jgi:hypothetical protein
LRKFCITHEIRASVFDTIIVGNTFHLEKQ